MIWSVLTLDASKKALVYFVSLHTLHGSYVRFTGSFDSVPVRSFCLRDITMANTGTAVAIANMPGGHAMQPSGAGETVASLIREIRREATTVHVDIAGRVKVRLMVLVASQFNPFSHSCARI